MAVIKLGLEQVDLFLIHDPRPEKDLEGVWKTFEKVKEDGLAKSIGVSNFSGATADHFGDCEN